MRTLPADVKTLHGIEFTQHPVAFFCGSLWWQCPRCGTPNKTRINRTNFKFRCRSNRCKQRYTFGARFGVPDPKYRGPRPIVPEDYIFPPVELFEWRSGERAHSLVEATSDSVVGRMTSFNDRAALDQSSSP